MELAGAALLHSLVLDHPFHNGNKRMGLVALLVFLDENKMMLICDEDSLFVFVLRVAQHRITNEQYLRDRADREVSAMAEWLHSNCRQVELGERPLPFRRLRSILNDYDCQFEHGSSGSKINISRSISERGFLGRKKSRTLRTQVYYVGEGREVKKNTIKEVRERLELSEEHGVDSRAFYDHDPISADEFIVKYRKILDRLAKL